MTTFQKPRLTYNCSMYINVLCIFPMKAVVLTVDRPCSGIRYDAMRGKHTPPADISKPVNFPDIPLTDLVNPAQTWDDVKWLVNKTKLPVILKGVLTARDAVKVADCGASGVIVSNHGGRLVMSCLLCFFHTYALYVRIV